jgi:hypothetical protein
MIALYDHIHELRGCVMTRRERAIIEAQLAAAVAQHAALDRAAGRQAASDRSRLRRAPRS